MPKRSTTKKNKGPKGKKARIAAKLERQWGEQADEEEVKKASFRKGKSRLKNGNAPTRIKSKPIHKKSRGEVKQLQELSADESAASSDESDTESDVGGGDGETLNSLLKNIDRVGSKLKRKNSIVSDEEYESDGTSSNRSDEPQSVENDQPSDNVDQIDFDFESIRPTGENPYVSHFSKLPLPKVNGEVPVTEAMIKKIKLKNLSENIVIQASADIKQRMEKPESSLAMGAFSHVRKSLMTTWARMNASAVHQNVDASEEAKSQPILSEMQAALYPAIANYCDVQVTCMNRENRDAIENMLMLHVLNHVLTANTDITSHNNIIRELEKKDDVVDTEEYRDQGYTRPKVLILLPTRSTAHKFAKTMIELLGDNCSIENEEKFDGEFGSVEIEEEENKESEKRRKAVQKVKGKDWLELFGDGVNSDDDFKIGIMMSNMKKKGKKSKTADSGVAVKLYSDFYHSDIIIASPLGLKMTTNDENEEDGDVDFLSSIEVVIAHDSDVLMMQNWDHMATIMDRLNRQPKKTTGIDFARVRNYLLSAQASSRRQTIMVSRFSDPHLISTFNRYSKSAAGKLKMRRKVPSDEASICNVLTSVRQVFQRVPSESFATQGERRVNYFKDTILPQLIRTKQNHTLIYIPSYFDFISVRNMMLKHEIASYHFVSITEYARVSEVNRGRARFLQGRKRIMLYTGRAHFFMRHLIKGAKHLIMLGLPENAKFYPELLNMLTDIQSHANVEAADIDSSPVSCLNLFTKYEAQSLERIVGTKHSERMVKSEKKTFLFSS